MDENTPYTPPQTPPPPPSGSDPVAKDKNENTLGIICHLLSFAQFVLVVPFGNIIGPLVLWLIKRADSPYLDAHGKEVVNFNLSWAIYGVVAGLSCFILIGFVIVPVLAIAWIVFVILGAVKASEGKLYRYPLTIRMIK